MEEVEKPDVLANVLPGSARSPAEFHRMASNGNLQTSRPRPFVTNAFAVGHAEVKRVPSQLNMTAPIPGSAESFSAATPRSHAQKHRESQQARAEQPTKRNGPLPGYGWGS